MQGLTVITLIETAPNSGSYMQNTSIPYEKRHAFFNPENQWSTPAMMAEDKDKVKEDAMYKLKEWNQPVLTYTEEDIIAVYQAAKNGFMLKEILTALKENK